MKGKEVPMVVYWDDMICPRCKHNSGDNDKLYGWEKYCFNCGQRIVFKNKGDN